MQNKLEKCDMNLFSKSQNDKQCIPRGLKMVFFILADKPSTLLKSSSVLTKMVRCRVMYYWAIHETEIAIHESFQLL